jgi:excisionase family DNA binding protein
MPEQQTERAVVQIRPAFLNKNEAAKYLGIGLTKFDELRRAGAFPTYAIGRAIVFKPDDLDEWLQSRAKVYFIACGKFVKIGVTTNINKRISSMKTWNPLEMRILAKIPGDRKTEKDLHLKFKKYRHDCEWFRLAGKLAKYIDSIDGV